MLVLAAEAPLVADAALIGPAASTVPRRAAATRLVTITASVPVERRALAECRPPSCGPRRAPCAAGAGAATRRGGLLLPAPRVRPPRCPGLRRSRTDRD